MEDMNDRGQMILIGSIMLALGLVALVFAVNGVLYSENLESEGINPYNERVGNAEQFVSHEVGSTIVWHNIVVPATATDSEVATSLTDNVSGLASPLRNETVRTNGGQLSVSVSSVDVGKIMRRASSGEFDEPVSGTNTWGVETWLAGSMSDARRVQFGVTNDATLYDPTSLSDAESNAFRVELIEPSTDTTEIYLFADGSDIVLGMLEPSDSTLNTDDLCNYQATGAIVDVTTGTMGGKSCYDLDDGTTIDDIRFVNGQNAQGNYTITMKDALGFGGAGDTTVKSATWSTTLDVQYRSSKMTLSSSQTLAPCSVDETVCRMMGIDGLSGGTTGGGGSNTAPTADAGSDVSVTEGTGNSVALDGSASSDPEGGLSYSWSKQDASDPGSLSDASTVTPDFDAPNDVSGNQQVTLVLTVTDAGGKTDTDTVGVTIVDDDGGGSDTAPTVFSANWVDGSATCTGSTCSVSVETHVKDDDGVSGDLDHIKFSLYKRGHANSYSNATSKVHTMSPSSDDVTVTHTFSGLEKNTKYYVTVRAEDAGGQAGTGDTGEDKPKNNS